MLLSRHVWLGEDVHGQAVHGEDVHDADVDDDADADDDAKDVAKAVTETVTRIIFFNFADQRCVVFWTAQCMMSPAR